LTGVDIPTFNFDIDWRIHRAYDDDRLFNPPTATEMMDTLSGVLYENIMISLVFTKEGIYAIYPKKRLVQEYAMFSSKQRCKYESMVQETVRYSVEYGQTLWTSNKKPYYDAVENLGFVLTLLPC